MALYIDRYFWLLLPVTIILCCVFAARAAASFTEARVFDDAPRASVEQTAAPATISARAGKDGTAFAGRNMFCPTCSAADEPAAATSTSKVEGVPITALPVVLVATNLSASPGASFASVVNTTTRHSGAYAVGQAIPGIGQLRSIRRASIDFVNRDNGRVERAMLIAPPAAKDTPARKKPGASKARPATDLTARLDAGISKIDDTHYQIDRSLFKQLTADPSMISGGRARPVVKNGEVLGMRVYAVRPNSAFSKLGLRNGDVLRSVNGIELSSSDPDKLLEAYTKLRTASSLSLVLDRRSKSVELHYSVR